MLKIVCPHCGQNHKGQDVNVSVIQLNDGKLTYKYYKVTCKKCGKELDWDRYTIKNLANKQKAIRRYNAMHKKPYKNEEAPHKEASKYTKKIKITDDSARALIIMILAQAALDSQNPKYKKEVDAFWDSEWCAELCSIIGRNPKDAKANCKRGDFAEFYRILIQ